MAALTDGTWPPGDVGARPPGDDGAWPPGGAPGPAIPGLKTALNRWAARLGDVPTQRTLDGWARAGIRLLCPGDPGWPSQLDVLGDSQPVGRCGCAAAPTCGYACLRSVSIVGTRAATGYGMSRLRRDGRRRWPSAGWAVVSGGAFGIDGCAHRGALSRRGNHVAVLPSGVDDPYPRGHDGLFQAIAAARRAGQRVAAGPGADPARVPGPQPA